MKCVDASVFLAWLLPEDYSEQADVLIAQATQEGSALIAPELVTVEVLSGLRRAVYRKRVTQQHSNEARATFESLALQLHQLPMLADSAWSIGTEVDSASLHDMFYLALAQREQCELWTADKRLINLLHRRFPLVHFVGELENQQ